ncbi:MAG TPA: hypothetical protein VG187_01235 [Mycobacterium sp.]|nr:hypothetical protein [Mycobacterium sp.]
MTVGVLGGFYNIEAGDDGYSVHRGDVLDLDPVHVERIVGQGYAQTDIDGKLRPAYEKPTYEEMVDLKTKIAMAQREPAGLRDKVTKVARIR